MKINGIFIAALFCQIAITAPILAQELATEEDGNYQFFTDTLIPNNVCNWLISEYITDDSSQDGNACTGANGLASFDFENRWRFEVSYVRDHDANSQTYFLLKIAMAGPAGEITGDHGRGFEYVRIAYAGLRDRQGKFSPHVYVSVARHNPRSLRDVFIPGGMNNEVYDSYEGVNETLLRRLHNAINSGIANEIKRIRTVSGQEP